jgi:monothiol bacilliredoxin
VNELTDLKGLDDALASKKGAQILYKHSTQCGICDAALEEIEAFLAKDGAAATIYYLDLLAHRDVSEAIARRLGVKHESPQAIVLKDGKVSAVLNHRAIRREALAKALAG